MFHRYFGVLPKVVYRAGFFRAAAGQPQEAFVKKVLSLKDVDDVCQENLVSGFFKGDASVGPPVRFQDAMLGKRLKGFCKEMERDVQFFGNLPDVEVACPVFYRCQIYQSPKAVNCGFWKYFQLMEFAFKIISSQNYAKDFIKKENLKLLMIF